MKIAFFDCFSGISGDMTLGALLDSGINEHDFRAELSKLPDIEFDLKISKVDKYSITATDVDVIIKDEHHHRHLKTITDIINSSNLSASVKNKSISIFNKLAEAEGKVHGSSPEEVHFHEVGAVDAIVDIVGSVIGLEMLRIDKIYSSPLPMGHGFVNAAHGLIPIPAPATIELLSNIPIYTTGIEGELVTPTGAAIISTLAESFGEMPPMILQSTGYGTGKKDFGIPNALRLFIGNTEQNDLIMPDHNVSLVETNIDDMNPEFYDMVFDKLFSAGAYDVYLSPIQMKKNRPGSLLCVICPENKIKTIAEIILRNTTSFGVRIKNSGRICLDRKWITVATEYGEIRMKIGSYNGEIIKASPEYEDCKQVAKLHNIDIRRVYEAAINKYLENK